MLGLNGANPASGVNYRLRRRKYVNNCVTQALKDRPNIDVMDVLKSHPDMKDLPMEKYDAS